MKLIEELKRINNKIETCTCSKEKLICDRCSELWSRKDDIKMILKGELKNINKQIVSCIYSEKDSGEYEYCKGICLDLLRRKAAIENAI